MQNVTDFLIPGSDNQINVDLYENGSLIVVSPTEIHIKLLDWKGDTALTITRTPTGDGVAYASGRITVTPADLTEDLPSLVSSAAFRVLIRIKTSGEPDGVWYGHDDSDERYSWVVQR